VIPKKNLNDHGCVLPMPGNGEDLGDSSTTFPKATFQGPNGLEVLATLKNIRLLFIQCFIQCHSSLRWIVEFGVIEVRRNEIEKDPLIL
jgi:hypothetical protein